MSKINLKVTEQYLSLQKDFIWKNIPAFAIVTGINGAGKTHLLNLLKTDIEKKKKLKITDSKNKIHKLILPTPNNNQSLNELLKYHSGTLSRLATIKNHENLISNIQDDIEKYQMLRDQKDNIHEIEELNQTINSFLAQRKNIEEQISRLIIYAYEKELESISKTITKDVSELTTEDIRKYANKNFMHITEIPDFEKFLYEDEYEISMSILSLHRHGLHDKAKIESKKERAFAKINNLFEKYGFTYFKMEDPFLYDDNKTILFGTNTKKLQRNSNQQVRIRFKGKKNEIVEYDSLSSGEKMIVKFTIWAMAKDQNGKRINTMLLDEPDAHLHPSMCKMMVDILTELSKPKEEGGSGIRIIMTTHSPSTVAFAPEGSLFLMEKDKENNRTIKATTTEDAVSILSDGIFTFEKAMSQFSLVLSSDKKNVLFVEGKTDVNHLNKAMKMLDFDLDIEIIDMHDASTLSNFIKSIPAKLFKQNKFIALFDNDEEGRKSYRNISGYEIKQNLLKKITATQCENKCYAVLIEPIENQTVYCPIEFLYPLEYLKNNNVLEKRSFSDYNNLYKGSSPEENIKLSKDFEGHSTLKPFKVKDNIKNNFSNIILNENEPSIFEGFRPTLDLIKEIIERE